MICSIYLFIFSLKPNRNEFTKQKLNFLYSSPHSRLFSATGEDTSTRRRITSIPSARTGKSSPSCDSTPPHSSGNIRPQRWSHRVPEASNIVAGELDEDTVSSRAVPGILIRY